jgi:hypothetical protein
VKPAGGDTTAESDSRRGLDLYRLRDRLGLPQILPDRSSSANQSGEKLSEHEQPPLPRVDEPTRQRISPGQSMWEDEIHKLIALLESDLGATTGRTEQSDLVRQQVALRMLYLLANDPQSAQRVIPQLPPAEQEFWTSVFLSLSHCLSPEGLEDPQQRAQAVVRLRAAVQHLQSAAPLEINGARFCRRIDGFGTYEPYSEDLFQAGESLLIYAELRNFLMEPLPGGGFESRIRSQVEIRRPGTAAISDQQDFGLTVDQCRSIRHDYYVAYRLELAPLSPGPYELRLEITDELTGKTATQILPFRIR